MQEIETMLNSIHIKKERKVGEEHFQRYTHVHSIKVPKSTIVSDSFIRNHQNSKISHTNRKQF